jgi:hypothetical protein
MTTQVLELSTRIFYDELSFTWFEYVHFERQDGRVVIIIHNKQPVVQLTKITRSDGVPEPDGTLKAVVRAKIIHYHQVYLHRPDPITFMSLAVDTSDHIYDDFSRVLFFHAHREESDLSHELPEESI